MSKTQRKQHTKRPATKQVASEAIWSENGWTVRSGELRRGVGKPAGGEALFSLVAEKIPFEALRATEAHVADTSGHVSGVYLAHDSMGHVRYAGRGKVFERLKARLKAAPDALRYFSFYILKSKKHEREVETLLIRIGGAHLHFNARKKRVDIEAGNITDYEPGTKFIVRQRKKGRK
jgi:mannose-6-phosphate isomerase-like protein (cupin superfamily)